MDHANVRTSFWRKDLKPAESALLLRGFRVRGRVHTEPGKHRFQDAWESLLRERRNFLPVTEARLESYDGRTLGETDFMLVDREDIEAAYPIDEANGRDPRARRIDRDAIRSAAILRNVRIEGRVHFDADRGRFSDAWESLLFDRRRFIPVTEATITDHGRTTVVDEPRFMLLDKEDVLAIHPLEVNGRRGSEVRRTDRVEVPAVLVLDSMRIEGSVHVEAGRSGFDRFSDLWDVLMRDTRRFLPVTDATLLSHDGTRVLGATEFMVVLKSDVLAAFPATTL